MLPDHHIQDYRASREPGTDQSVLCHAPFVSLNFERSGNVTSCCYNRFVVLGTYPTQSLEDMWNSETARGFRKDFLENREVPTCALCFHQLGSGNFAGTLMRNFDAFSTGHGYAANEIMPYPRVLEFEIANTCNLECVMCDGRWSSAIRARREKLPPLRSPYDLEFVRQLEPFLPHIAHAKFLGGEPFLIRRYYDIWERLITLGNNPLLTITTNASFLPERARSVLEGLRADIVISLDAVTPGTYEAIRRNAQLDVVLENVDYLHAYCQRRGTGMTLAVCPMTYNWRELHTIVEFAEARAIGVHFNMVIRPLHASLLSLSDSELTEVQEYLAALPAQVSRPISTRNRAQVQSLSHQVASWQGERQAFEERSRAMARAVREFARVHVPDDAWSPECESVVDAVVRGYLVGDELENAAHWDLRNLLPQPPLTLWSNDAPPPARVLLFVGQLLLHFVEQSKSRAIDAESRTTSPGASLAAAYYALGKADGPGRVTDDEITRAGEDVRARLISADSIFLLSALREFRAVVDESIGRMNFDDRIRRALPAATARIDSGVMEDARRQRALAYVHEYLLVGASAAELPRGADGLRLRFDGLLLCHQCIHPEQPVLQVSSWLDRMLDEQTRLDGGETAIKTFDDTSVEQIVEMVCDLVAKADGSRQ